MWKRTFFSNSDVLSNKNSLLSEAAATKSALNFCKANSSNLIKDSLHQTATTDGEKQRWMSVSF